MPENFDLAILTEELPVDQRRAAVDEVFNAVPDWLGAPAEVTEYSLADGTERRTRWVDADDALRRDSTANVVLHVVGSRPDGVSSSVLLEFEGQRALITLAFPLQLLGNLGISEVEHTALALYDRVEAVGERVLLAGPELDVAFEKGPLAQWAGAVLSDTSLITLVVCPKDMAVVPGGEFAKVWESGGSVAWRHQHAAIRMRP